MPCLTLFLSRAVRDRVIHTAVTHIAVFSCCTCAVIYNVLNQVVSISTADVVSVNSACRCVHLPYDEMLCDPVGCELV